jgi:hypothetical protein
VSGIRIRISRICRFWIRIHQSEVRIWLRILLSSSKNSKKQCCGSGIRCIFDPWIWDPGWVESQHPDPGSGMNNPDHIFQSLEIIFLVFFRVTILKFFDADPGWKKVGSGINIPDPQHWYEKL